MSFSDDQRDARTVRCRYCHAGPSEACRNLAAPDDRPLRGHVSHTCRITDARRASAVHQPELALDAPEETA